MEWQITYLSETNIILIKVTGVCNATNTVPIIKAVQTEAERYSCLDWLLDMRAAVRYFDNLDYYRRPFIYDSLLVSTAMRKAVVFPEIGEQELFYEAACRNRGYNVSVFSEIDAAMAWLTAVRFHNKDRVEKTERPI